MSQRRGLTLIELLVSISLGMVLLAMGSSALVQVTRIAKRDTAHRQAHDDVATLNRNLSLRLGALYHGAQTRVEADPGPDGAWGTGDEILSLFWMHSMRSREERSLNLDQPYGRSLVWNQLQWIGDGEGGGEIRLAVSTPSRSSTWFHYTDSDGDRRRNHFRNTPQWRRDRQRDLDDNDGRWITGMTKAVLDEVDLPGDREDLAEQLLRAHPPTTKVTDFVIEWIDAGGVRVRCDAVQGVTLDGAALLGTAWSNQRVHVVDGTFVDGRNHIAAGGTRRAMAERPCLIRFGFTLIPTSNSGLPLEQEPQLPFSLTFATTPQLPTL